MSAHPNDLTASLKYERQFQARGYQLIGGIDEAGRGPWAGPLVAAIVVLPLDNLILSQVLQGVRDSKQMSQLQRHHAAERIKNVALSYGYGVLQASELNSLHDMTRATYEAYRRAYQAVARDLGRDLDALLIDYFVWSACPVPYQAITHGDQHSLSIASASVLAKVWRDETMLELDAQYPDYGFAQHKGYGTAKHRAALEKYGICDQHRTHYKPIQAIINRRLL